MLKKVIAGVVGVLILAIGATYLMPGSVHVERSTLINAPRETVFPWIASFQKFHTWSPWASRDPNTEYTYEGADTGVGGVMRWSSQHPDVGTGSQTHTLVKSPERVENTLDFGQMGVATAYFQLEENERGNTRVIWGMDTDLGLNPLARAFGPMIERGVTADYDAGLKKLRMVIEEHVNSEAVAAARPPSDDSDDEQVEEN